MILPERRRNPFPECFSGFYVLPGKYTGKIHSKSPRGRKRKMTAVGKGYLTMAEPPCLGDAFYKTIE